MATNRVKESIAASAAKQQTVSEITQILNTVTGGGGANFSCSQRPRWECI
jgi:hypothetical protein